MRNECNVSSRTVRFLFRELARGLFLQDTNHVDEISSRRQLGFRLLSRRVRDQTEEHHGLRREQPDRDPRRSAWAFPVPFAAPRATRLPRSRGEPRRLAVRGGSALPAGLPRVATAELLIESRVFSFDAVFPVLVRGNFDRGTGRLRERACRAGSYRRPPIRCSSWDAPHPASTQPALGRQITEEELRIADDAPENSSQPIGMLCIRPGRIRRSKRVGQVGVTTIREPWPRNSALARFFDST